MSSAKITLYGMAKYFTDRGGDLFSNLTLPAGADREIFINTLLLKGAEFEVLYANADFFKEAIGTWSSKWNRTFTKWVTALNVEYNPLENYDRTEIITDVNTGTVKNTGDVKNTGTQSADNKISAFNSSTLENNALDTRTDDLTQTNNLTQTNDLTLTHNARIRGNIGVTTSQQMLQSELDIAYWNLYDHMADLFLQEFVLPVY